MLDKLIGKNGIKSDLTVSIGNDTYFKLGATILVTFVMILFVQTVLNQAKKG